VDFSKLQWVVKVLELIGKDEKVRRFCYALVLFAGATVLIHSLAALITAIRWW
jgi:hypothetical protein